MTNRKLGRVIAKTLNEATHLTNKSDRHGYHIDSNGGLWINYPSYYGVAPRAVTRADIDSMIAEAGQQPTITTMTKAITTVFSI